MAAADDGGTPAGAAPHGGTSPGASGGAKPGSAVPSSGTQPARPPRWYLALRLVRIAAIAATLVYLFHLSHEASAARGYGDVPGMLWAFGALSVLFFIRALVAEGTERSATGVQKDLLWGLSAGLVVTILIRL